MCRGDPERLLSHLIKSPCNTCSSLSIKSLCNTCLLRTLSVREIGHAGACLGPASLEVGRDLILTEDALLYIAYDCDAYQGTPYLYQLLVGAAVDPYLKAMIAARISGAHLSITG